MPVSLFPRRPTAHAQVMKSSPRPLASPKSRKNTQDFRSTHDFLMDVSRISLVTCGTCVTPERRHALDINKWTWERVFASWRQKSWALDEAILYSGWNLWMTTVWLNRFLTWQKCLKRNGKRAVRSKKQTECDTVDHWHVRDDGLLSNDWLENKQKRLLLHVGRMWRPSGVTPLKCLFTIIFY